MRKYAFLALYFNAKIPIPKHEIDSKRLKTINKVDLCSSVVAPSLHQSCQGLRIRRR